MQLRPYVVQESTDKLHPAELREVYRLSSPYQADKAACGSGHREETAMELEQRVKPHAARWESPTGWTAPQAACLPASAAAPGPGAAAARG